MTTQRTRQVVEEDGHDHDAGLSLDLPTMITRRRALGLAALGGLTTILAACGSGDGGAAGATTSGASTATATTTSSGDASVAEVPEETAGPYPADGSNGVNVLTESGIVRSDITRSFGTGSAVAAGVPLTIAMTVLDVQAGGTPVRARRSTPGTATGRGATRSTTARSRTRTTCAGCRRPTRPGRSRSPASSPPATRDAGRTSTSRSTPAWPRHGGRTDARDLPDRPSQDACATVYATSGYEQSVSNLSQVSLATDMVFADGYSTQLGTVTGSAGSGMTVSLNVGT